MNIDPDKNPLKQRLKDAIENSKAIQNLSDNPLLLTMMAVLNRRQELPRDRADLYDQASRVLLYHWDVDHKRLQLPMDAIGRREKQDMLRLIAYEMQAGVEGLKGNLISAESLTQVLTNYLRNQGFSEPREKANLLIQQLRERNFILCYRGADTYGFVHRTFLEYFCAVEIVNRFEKQRVLSFEQLRDNVFSEHWQDETWHEVLRLICGMIDPKFAEQVIKFLMTREVDKAKFLSDIPWETDRLAPGGLSHLLLASDYLSEVNKAVLGTLTDELLKRLQREGEHPEIRLSYSLSQELINRIARHFDDTFSWLQIQVERNRSSFVQLACVRAIADLFDDAETLDSLEEWAQYGSDWGIRVGAVEAIGKKRSLSNQKTLDILEKIADKDDDWGVRRSAIEVVALLRPDVSKTFEFLSMKAANDSFVRTHQWEDNPRQKALEILVGNYSNNPKSFELLKNSAINDPDPQLREWAQKWIEELETQRSIEAVQ